MLHNRDLIGVLAAVGLLWYFNVPGSSGKWFKEHGRQHYGGRDGRTPSYRRIAGEYMFVYKQLSCSKITPRTKELKFTPRTKELKFTPRTKELKFTPRTKELKFTPRKKELILQFKTLYVLSKIRIDSKSNFTEILDAPFANATNSTANAEEQETSNYTLWVRQELCAGSGIDNEELFYCSKLLPSSDNIFFVETSCAANQTAGAYNITLPLSEKQACSIYSAAYYNPLRKVILLFTCPVPVGYKWTKDWNTLFDLANFFFGRVNMTDLYANTSLYEFYMGPLARSKYPVSHQSDLFRQFILYMYGGTYMDLDVISFKSLGDLGVNYVIHQGDDLITAGVWNFEPGHYFLRQCLSNGISHYLPDAWSIIGPDLFTATLKCLCNVNWRLDPKLLMTLVPCNIRVLPMGTFFSVHYSAWSYFYYSTLLSEVERMTWKSHGVHYWNHAGNLTLHVGSKQPIVQFAKEHCPPVYHNAGLILS